MELFLIFLTIGLAWVAGSASKRRRRSRVAPGAAGQASHSGGDTGGVWYEPGDVPPLMDRRFEGDHHDHHGGDHGGDHGGGGGGDGGGGDGGGGGD